MRMGMSIKRVSKETPVTTEHSFLIEFLTRKYKLVAWRSGYASVCKTEYAGSIPAATSNCFLIKLMVYFNYKYI